MAANIRLTCLFFPVISSRYTSLSRKPRAISFADLARAMPSSS